MLIRLVLLLSFYVGVCVSRGITVPCTNCTTDPGCAPKANGTGCGCILGYFNYGKDVCEDIDECSRGKGDPCGHRGICTNTIGGYNCACLDGWSGPESHCRTNTSLDPDCMPGYYGDLCENTLCGKGYASVVPENNTAFVCNCDHGWTSKEPMSPCVEDIDECQNASTCSGNGKCTNTPGRYQCSCNQPWTGSDCSFYDVCSIQNCTGNRTCEKTGSDNDTTYRCVCPNNALPEYCTPDTTTSSTSTFGTTMPTTTANTGAVSTSSVVASTLMAITSAPTTAKPKTSLTTVPTPIASTATTSQVSTPQASTPRTSTLPASPTTLTSTGSLTTKSTSTKKNITSNESKGSHSDKMLLAQSLDDQGTTSIVFIACYTSACLMLLFIVAVVLAVLKRNMNASARVSNRVDDETRSDTHTEEPEIERW